MKWPKVVFLLESDWSETEKSLGLKISIGDEAPHQRVFESKTSRKIKQMPNGANVPDLGNHIIARYIWRV